jgi:hypothetical protein
LNHKKLFIISCLFFLSSCSGISPVCRHYSLMNALVYSEKGYNINIATGNSLSNPSKFHAQAQAFINGKWKWLKFKNGKVYISKQDYFIVIKRYSIKEFIAQILSKEQICKQQK